MFGKKITKIIHIEGLMCKGCVKRVENVLSAINEVKEFNVSLENKCATVVLKKEVSDEFLTNAITNLGFKITSIE